MEKTQPEPAVALAAAESDQIAARDLEDAASIDGGGASDEDGPRWPDEASEASFLSDQPPRLVEISVPVTKNSKETENGGAEPEIPLPPLQSLIDRIPAEARETLDELFRARFVSVKRVQQENLKNGSDAN